jgi:hypothetical protein
MRVEASLVLWVRVPRQWWPHSGLDRDSRMRRAVAGETDLRNVSRKPAMLGY